MAQWTHDPSVKIGATLTICPLNGLTRIWKDSRGEFIAIANQLGENGAGSSMMPKAAIPTTINYFTCPKFTVLVEVDDKNVIILGPPIVRKFIGKTLYDLHNWATAKFGESESETLECSINKSVSSVKRSSGPGLIKSTLNVVRDII